MISYALRKLKEKHNKPQFPGDFFELQRKKPKVAAQVVQAIENQQNSIKDFTQKNFELAAGMFRRYLLFVVHVGTALRRLGEFDAMSYFKYLVFALKHNYNYFGKRGLEHSIKMNFFMLCLVFNRLAQNAKDTLPEAAMKVFSSSIKYFCLYMAWERAERDFIMDTIISVVTQMVAEHRKKLSESCVNSVTRALIFYQNHAKTKALPDKSLIQINKSNEDDELEYFEGITLNMFREPRDFLDPGGHHLQNLKE